MAKYRKKPVVIEATQWFKHGDHVEVIDSAWESFDYCPVCGLPAHRHGKIKTLEGFHIVCPGDWIITGVVGEHYPCKPDIFEMTYATVEGFEPCAECGATGWKEVVAPCIGNEEGCDSCGEVFCDGKEASE